MSLGLALAAAEAGLRLARPLWALTFPPVCLVPSLFEPWAVAGYRLHPGRTMPLAVRTWVSRPTTIHANADGFRASRPLDDPDDRPRLVVLGDSMVFRVGVEEGERFTERLETAVPGWRVDNLGMVGYGPDLMVRALEEVGLRTVPRAVVLAMYTDDFRRVVPHYQGAGFALPRFVLEDGRLQSIPYPEPTAWDRARLVQGLRYVLWRYTAATFPLTGAILERFASVVRGHGARPALVFLPDRDDGRDDRRRRGWLNAWAAAHGVPFLDLTTPLHERGVEHTYLPGDTHWSPEGHQLVADTRRGWLEEGVMAPPGGGA